MLNFWRAWVLGAAPLVLAACPRPAVSDAGMVQGAPSDAGAARDAALLLPDASAGLDAANTEDAAGVPDAAAPMDGGPQMYAYVPPPLGAVPPDLQPARWMTHLRDDLLPYWTSAEAQGSPWGNFPTYRSMDGTLAQPTQRRPRMLSRQIYLYAMAYMLTGDEALLALSHAGLRWLLQHAWDDVNGGWFEQLDLNGAPVGQGIKTAQDSAYAAMGPAAYYFVTRDPAAEQAVLNTRDLIMDPHRFWDANLGRVRDAMSFTLAGEIDVDNDGAELVAQLDQINAYMLLVQPVLQSPVRRLQFLEDMHTLGNVLLRDFLQDGIFWGATGLKGQYLSKHADFGHTLKSLWMLLQLDKRLAAHPFHAAVLPHAPQMLERAFDGANGMWAKRPSGPASVEYGSDWWIYAESDQLAQTLTLLGESQVDKLRQTLPHWLTSYVDGALHEVIPSINRDGSRAYNWQVGDTAKCNEWKNGFHSVEHALMAVLVGSYLQGAPVPLYFAVPAAQATTFPVRPYLLDGQEVSRESLGSVTVDGVALQKVRVIFDRLH